MNEEKQNKKRIKHKINQIERGRGSGRKFGGRREKVKVIEMILDLKRENGIL